jgi:ribonuclease-3
MVMDNPAAGFAQQFEQVTQLRFRDRSLLQQALTHSSYVNELSPAAPVADNERLEFIGDAILSFVVSDILYRRFPDLQEGGLTKLRAALVRREALARFAARLSLGDGVLVGRGEAESGGRERLSLLSDTFEAIVGAVYLDQGLEATRAFLDPLLEEELLRALDDRSLTRDPKSRLQEWSQAELGVTPRYRIVASQGPDHRKMFVAEVSLAGRSMGVGRGPSKQDSSQAAAAMALYRLDLNAPEYAADEEAEAAHPLPPVDWDHLNQRRS